MHVWWPLQIQPSILNVCPNVVAPANPLCISNDTSNMSFEDRVCTCPPQCQAPPTHATPATSVSPLVIGVVAGGGGALLVALILSTLFCCWCYKRSRKLNQMASVDQKTSVVEPLNSGSPNSTSTKSTKTSHKSIRASYNTTSQEVDGPSSVVSTTGSKASDGYVFLQFEN